MSIFSAVGSVSQLPGFPGIKVKDVLPENPWIKPVCDRDFK